MKIRDLKIYFKFLAKNRFYTFASIFGFSVSLMFVILLSLYAKQELSVDSFHKKKDRLFLMAHDVGANFGNTVAPFVKDRFPEVESYCRFYNQDVFIKGREEIIMADALLADSTFFEMFSFNLIEGIPSQVLNGERLVVLTQSFANKVFGGEDPIGKTLNVDDWEHTVTGIMEDTPYNTQFKKFDFVMSYTSITNETYFGGDWVLNTSNNFGFPVYFLIKEGADITTKAPQLLELFKEELWFFRDGFTDNLKFVPIEDVYFEIRDAWNMGIKGNSKSLINIYITIAILILIVATLNYINMTVAQSGFRGKESAIKKLLGADRESIAAQLMGEALLMAIMTFGIGLLLAFLCEPFFNEILNTKIELAQQFTLSNILIGVLFILLVAVVSGLIPSVVISSFNPLEVVKGSFKKRLKTSYSKALTTFQYIVAIALLISSFFIKQQSDYLINYELGYNRENILSMDIRVSGDQKEGLKSKLLSIPGVEQVSFSSGTPMNGGNNFSFEEDGVSYSVQEILVDEDFFELYGITADPADAPLTEKELFISKPLFNSPLVDKEKMVFRYVENEYNIIGVLEDFHIRSLDIGEIGYMRIRKLPADYWPWNLNVKITGDTNKDIFATADRVKEEYTSYIGTPPSFHEFVDDTIEGWYVEEQNQSKIISAFTILTLIISVMGVLAMSMYTAKQKEKEIGIRKVNGATVGQILLLLNKDSQMRILIAFVIASPIAYYAISKWLENFAYRITINWWVFVVAGVIVSLLTLLTVSYMTWRAARANPVETLKSE